MKYVMLIGLILFSISGINAQSSPVVKESENCSRIDSKTVACSLIGQDQNLDLGNDKVLDSLFKSGQNSEYEEPEINEYQGWVLPDGTSGGDVKGSDMFSKRIIISKVDRSKKSD